MKRFIDIISSEQLTLVDFYASWCGPCESQATVLSELKADYKGKIRFIKVDIERNPTASNHYGIRSIPTLLLFRKGNIVWRHIGLASYPELKQVLDYHVSPQMAV